MCKIQAMSIFIHPNRHRVAVLVRDGVLPIELGIAHRLFGQAKSAEGEFLYEVRTCTLVPGQVRTDTDITVNVTHGPAGLSEADTVIVPASDEDYEPHSHAGLSSPLVDALGLIRPATRIASICTGSFVLAAAGLLNGLRATTHWRVADQFRMLYPAVDLDPDVLYTDEGRILTSAGVASGIDLCLHMIRSDYGSSVANDVARGTIVSPHRDGGQAQFIQHPVPETELGNTRASRMWALKHLDEPVSLNDLAKHESVSVRTYTRHFRQEVGVSPLQWLNQQRIDLARQLLEETDLSIDQIAVEAGFGTATSLRQHLYAALRVSPSTYRNTFRVPAADPTKVLAPMDYET
ncbi:transcriptional regulator, AraC family with amidase-like domain [Cryobacterium luteum]|nr:transcriptional regulator, AraC family with amidase-like domain [Cryobacterium luteum]